MFHVNAGRRSSNAVTFERSCHGSISVARHASTLGARALAAAPAVALAAPAGALAVALAAAPSALVAPAGALAVALAAALAAAVLSRTKKWRGQV